MKSVRFNQPKYVVPLIVLPFLILCFYVYRMGEGVPEAKADAPVGMQGNIGNASQEVQRRAFDDKLDAFAQQYKEADGNTAVNPIADQAGLDSIDRLMKERFMGGGSVTGYPAVRPVGASGFAQDPEMARALASLQRPAVNQPGLGADAGFGQVGSVPVQQRPVAPVGKDPMELFRQQMAYMDSVSKANDPELKAERDRMAAVERAESLERAVPRLKVVKELDRSDVFNTVVPDRRDHFIMAVIDENVTGYAGSRIRLRLLEDVRAGKVLVRKGTYLYALISGFRDQRVTLSVRSILQDGRILPVKLDLYDTDGLPGLYVPESAFREFTRDLGGSSMQGVNIQGNSASASQFLMSSMDKMFQSTSSAIAAMIRKNKAKIKYNSYIYLIDPDELQKEQQGY